MQQLVTATTFMVLTNVNKFVVILFGVVVLHDRLTAVGGVGMLLAMGGGLWYGQARSRLSEGVASVAWGHLQLAEQPPVSRTADLRTWSSHA